MARNIIIGCITLGLLVFAQSAVGVQYDYELAYGSSSRDSGSREAVAMDDWLERGRAAVTESPIFPDGVRLTAWGGEDAYEPGLASAVYYFKVPRWAQYLKITVQYRDAAQDDTIAGRLWIKSADRDKYEALGAEEEAPLYGDTFVLRSERTSETIIVPRSRHVEDDTVEMHIVAEGQDCLDVRDVRLVFLETRPDNITIVHRTYNDYWDRWPRYRYAYHYYYWGPLFWPKTLVVYECWDVPSPFYWITWRPWFFVNIIRVHHHYPWWGPRRYTVIYHVDLKQPPVKRKPLIHQQLKERHVYITKTIHPTPPTRNTVPPAMPDKQPRQQEVRLKKETAPSGTAEATIKRNPTQPGLQKQPVRADTGQATQQSRQKPVNREKTIQVPAQKQLNQADSVDPKTTKSVRSTPPLRPDTRQLNQNTKETAKPPVNTQTKPIKEAQVLNKPDTRSAHPSPTVTPRIQQKEQPQPRAQTYPEPTVPTAPPTRLASPNPGAPDPIRKNQSNPNTAQDNSVPRGGSQGTAQSPAPKKSSKHQVMEQTTQMQLKTQNEDRPQSRREIHQPLPQTEQRGHR
jgi:hypothetical protein